MSWLKSFSQHDERQHHWVVAVVVQGCSETHHCHYYSCIVTKKTLSGKRINEVYKHRTFISFCLFSFILTLQYILWNKTLRYTPSERIENKCSLQIILLCRRAQGQWTATTTKNVYLSASWLHSPLCSCICPFTQNPCGTASTLAKEAKF